MKNNETENANLLAALVELDRELVEIDGISIKPSQCYHLAADPPHVLFNTNCPDSLKEKVQAILAQYTDGNETNTQQ